MSLVKKDICKNITNKTHISHSDSKKILNSFLNLIKKNSLQHPVKISNFGTFFLKKTLERIGRNPKTKEDFVVPVSLKLSLKASNNIRKFLN